MWNNERAQAAADMLWSSWQEGRRIAALPDDLRPGTRAEGYAVQALLERRSKSALFGWKIAATSRAGQEHIGVDGPIAGRLLAERVKPAGAQLQLDHNAMRVAEPEFAFRIGADLPPRSTAYTVEQVLAAVESLHPAIEVPDSRYENFAQVGAAQLIADNACAHEFVLGAASTASWRSLNLVEHEVMGVINDGAAAKGKGANVLGDPRVALTWLANELSRLEITLRAGQTVTTGTCMVPLTVKPRDRVFVDFGILGTLTARF
jgi:2-keto-4-pentenoate hydratase